MSPMMKEYERVSMETEGVVIEAIINASVNEAAVIVGDTTVNEAALTTGETENNEHVLMETDIAVNQEAPTDTEDNVEHVVSTEAILKEIKHILLATVSGMLK